MAKKRKKLDMTEEQTDEFLGEMLDREDSTAFKTEENASRQDVEDLAMILTFLVYYVNPAINKESTYVLLCDSLIVGLGLDNVRTLGKAIKNTEKHGISSSTPSSKTQH